MYLEDWTGSTETFSLGIDSFDKFIESHQAIISKLKTEEPPKHVLTYGTYYDSFEIGGKWYPNKKSVRDNLGISDVYINKYLSGEQSLYEILNPTLYHYGTVNAPSIAELCRKLRISVFALGKRTGRGLTLSEAIVDLLENPPAERISTVLVDGVRTPLKCLWESFGLKPKSANNMFLRFNKDIYATLRHYKITTDKTIELVRTFD